MGHTRWATHGGPTDRNAHPHTDVSGRVAVIHNGIIENFAGAAASSSRPTASRCAATPTPRWSRTCSAPAFANGPTAGDLPASMAAVCRGLDGAFTLVAVHADVPEMLVAARRNSPLVVGVGDGEMFVASDVAAFIAHTREAVELGQDQLVVITPDGYEITSFTGGERRATPSSTSTGTCPPPRRAASTSSWTRRSPSSRRRSPTPCSGHFDGSGIVLDEQRLSDDDLRTIDKVFVVACGTAYHSGLIAKYAIEHWSRIPVEVEVASEFRYRDPVLDRDTLVVAVSQSGETADTLEAVRHARRQRRPGAGRLQHQRLADPAGVRRRALHARRTRGRRRGDQGVPGPAHRELPGRAGAGAGPRHQVPGRDRPGVRAAQRRCRRPWRRRWR